MHAKGFLQASSRSHYGLRIMTQLAGAGGEVLSLHVIAGRERLSLGYLEELARRLKAGGLIESTRGTRGGYRLSREATSITVADILAAVEGPVRTMACVGDDAGRSRCSLEGRCPSRLVWQRANDQLEETFAGLTLADLLDRAASSPATR